MALDLVLFSVSTLFFLAAVYFSFRLSREVEGEPYWAFFIIAALGFGLAHSVSSSVVSFPLDDQTLFVLHEGGEIIGAFSLAYACYGLYSAMKKIRQKLSE